MPLRQTETSVDGGTAIRTSAVIGAPSARVTSTRPGSMHGTVEAAKRHDEMGFHEGWGIALDQLVAVAKEM